MSNFKNLVMGIFAFCFVAFNSLSAAGDFNLNYLEIDRNSYITLNEIGDTEANVIFELEDFNHEPIWIEGEKFDQLLIGNQPVRRKNGYPALPSIVKFMLIPPQAGIELTIKNLSSRIESGINPAPMVKPDEVESFPGAILMEDVNPDIIAAEVSLQSDENGFWPPQAVSIGRPAVMRGYRIMQITINPIRYNIHTKELEVIESIDFSLHFKPDVNAVNIIKNPSRDVSSRAVNRIIQALVINPPPQRDDPITGGSIMYVMGDWDGIEEDLEPLVEWRRRMGWTVEVVRVASQTANTIRNVIIDAYEEWENPPEHVVICGDTQGPNNRNPFPRGFFDARVNANYPYETDHPFAELEGDDFLPETTVGRLIFENRNMLRDIVAKTVLYESEPYIGEGDDFGWQKRAAVAAVDNRSGTSSIDICRWTREMLLKYDYDQVNEFYWDNQNQRPNVVNFINTNFNDGISVYLHRGWTNMNGFDQPNIHSLRNDRMLPFVILATCNTGDYAEHIYDPNFSYTERFSFDADGGAIGAVGFAGASHTAYNNLLSATVVKAFVNDGIYSQGWALMKAKIALYRNYFERDDIDHLENRGMEAWLCEYYIFNLMGDPVVDLFTDSPNLLIVEAPEQITTGTSTFETTITFEDGEEPVEDALVCLYKPGEFQLATRTDSEGFARFNLDPDWTQDGEIQFTVTGHNLMTFMNEYEIAETDMFLGNGGFDMNDGEDGEANGDGDGIANQLERLELTVQIANFGSEVPEGEISASLTTEMAHLEVIQGNFEAEAAPEAGESVAASFLVDIGGGFPSGKDAVLNLTVTAGEMEWVSSVIVPVEGPELIFESFAWVEDELEPGGTAEMIITIRNIGTKPTPALNGTIFPFTRTVGAAQPNGEFAAIDEGESGNSDGAFRLSAHPLHVAGSIGEFGLRLESQGGFVDTCYFAFNVSMGSEGDPFGPDAYGYLCFDNLDTNWFMAPDYEWIDLDPEQDGPGTDTELNDRGESQDESMVIDLPFTFTYYGQDFNEITICTNGWAALGDHHVINTAKNRRIPGGLVGSSMLCPFWDDLITTNDGGIYTWFDEENHIFVIEWLNMRKLGPRGNNEPIETFEIILYDPEFYPSFTGDGDIKFQYLEIEDNRSCFTTWDVPFATVGIGDPDQSTGLEYTYGGELTPGAAALDSGRAILFSTLIEFEVADIRGRVIDVITEDPIADVVVISTYGFSAMTDSNGVYEMLDVLVDTSIQYTVTASKVFFNDSTTALFDLEPEDELEINFGLLRPGFSLEVDFIDVAIERENANDFYFPLVNNGSGVMHFSSMLDLSDFEPGRDEMFEVYLEFPVNNAFLEVTEEGDSLFLGNNRIAGNTFIDSLFYIGGSGESRGDGVPSQIYRFSRYGDFVDSLQLPWRDNRAIQGMSYDGRYIWATYRGNLYKIEKEGEIIDDVNYAVIVDTVAIDTIRGSMVDVAIDLERREIYTCGITSEIVVLDTIGNVLNIFDPLGDNNRSLRKYGLAWYAEAPDSLNLLIIAHISDEEVYALYGINPISGDTRRLYDFNDIGEGRIKGIDVTGRWNSSAWTLHVTVDHNEVGDYISVYELAPNTTWISYSPESGTLEAGQDTVLHIRIESGMRPLDRYWLMMKFSHNADPGFQDIPIVLNIVEFSDLPVKPELPVKFSLEQNWPNPFNPSTTLSYSLPEAGQIKLTIYDTMGRTIEQLVAEYQDRGNYRVTFDGSSLPTGMYVYQLSTATKTITKKMVLLK